MASQNLPIIFREQLNLCNQFGINATDVNFKSCTMESDKFICIKDTNANGKPKSLFFVFVFLLAVKINQVIVVCSSLSVRFDVVRSRG